MTTKNDIRILLINERIAEATEQAVYRADSLQRKFAKSIDPEASASGSRMEVIRQTRQAIRWAGEELINAAAYADLMSDLSRALAKAPLVTMDDFDAYLDRYEEEAIMSASYDSDLGRSTCPMSNIDAQQEHCAKFRFLRGLRSMKRSVTMMSTEALQDWYTEHSEEEARLDGVASDR